jgi:NADH-quinone oxidoreductase subunit F
MMGRTFCPLGDAAAMPTIAFVKKFRSEFEDYLAGARVANPLIQIQPVGEPELAGAH